ncbi:MAG: riboflavin synthase [Candidatus Dormibacteraeota bacterium]|nr:riboflavin synthase [Candidatus Dormibacteraeota bacterium]
MFTGIISALGTVVEWRPGHLGIAAPDLRRGLVIGASVSVNGVCLTVVELEGANFFCDVVPETRERTNLGLLQPGDLVNLEPALRADQGLDGHLVQGHVDGTARVLEVRPVELGREVRIELPEALAPFVAEKGSIAVDGTSLTVTTVDDHSFGIAFIPHTLEVTVAGAYRPRSLVNLEVDVVARYVARLLRRSGGTVQR